MAMTEQAESGFPGAWYVVFHGSERRDWWRFLCRPRFRHVLAFGFCVHADAWLVYDVTLGRTYVRAMKREAWAAWFESLPVDRTVLIFDCPGGDAPVRNPGFRLGFWCSPAVAHLVGVSSRALRPEALYRDLLAQGARPAFTSEPT